MFQVFISVIQKFSKNDEPFDGQWGKDVFPPFSAKPATAKIATGCRQRALFRAVAGLRWHGCLL